MIEKLTKGEMFEPYTVGKKLNELIDGYNEFRKQMYPLQANIMEDFSVRWSVSEEYIKEHTSD